jgi:uncharacterized protein YdbL (DUF1318 family)
MKPQETIIFMLGELKGQMSSLQTSVENRDQAQADINKANEADHAEFRRDISAVVTDVAVLKDNRLSQRYTKSELTQKWMVWAGIPATLLGLITLATMIINK